MKILAVDTSTKTISIALLSDEKPMALLHKNFLRSQGSAVVSEVKKLLENINWRIEEIELFCAGTGPGSFTGLRTSLAAIRTFSIALKRPLVGVSSFDVIANNFTGQANTDVCILFDARQNNAYARFYKQKEASAEPYTDFILKPLEDILDLIKQPTIIAGDIIKQHKEKILKAKKGLVFFAPEESCYPKADVLGKLALVRYKAGYKDSPYKLLPLYIYPKECQIARLRVLGSSE
ncbi:MAG: tRNA (adenosine(37)-N6)-threonylcarbamoyltransferase complex dimerization subunit type 1 TsaB [Candidatus Omnitrophota bacterium]